MRRSGAERSEATRAEGASRHHFCFFILTRDRKPQPEAHGRSWQDMGESSEHHQAAQHSQAYEAGGSRQLCSHVEIVVFKEGGLGDGRKEEERKEG